MPYSYPTTPGVTYAVECAAEVFVTNPQTGAVAVSGDGSATVYFTATDALYDISDDSAKVQPLFKLAPRLKLALLQGGAGGRLPTGFTELEYLWSSGTQYIITDVLPSERQRIEVTGATSGQAKIMCFVGAHSGAGYDTRVQIFADAVPHEKTYRVNLNNITLHVPADTLTTSVIDMLHGIVCDNGAEAEMPVARAMPTVPYGLFARNRDAAMDTQYNLVGKICNFRVFNEGVLSADFVPVLNAEGTPGMYDKVSKTYFGNDGSGTFGYRIKGADAGVKPMSLRDPWRVAPSGVYARGSGENALEILADTEETTGDGWEWFANVAEAYEHFGVVPQEEELLTE